MACGVDVPNGWQYCQQCSSQFHNPLINQQQPPVINPMYYDQQYYNYIQSKKDHEKKQSQLCIGVAGAVMIMGIMFLIFMMADAGMLADRNALIMVSFIVLLVALTLVGAFLKNRLIIGGLVIGFGIVVIGAVIAYVKDIDEIIAGIFFGIVLVMIGIWEIMKKD
jgi:MFS family permease